MKLKGHAKVMLFDAKTGELTDCTESDNLVTNFFDAVFNENQQRFMKIGGYGFAQAMCSLTDLAVDLFGGVMVFSQPIENDPAHIYPTFAEAGTMIGNGNQQASIVGSSFKGTLNSAETVIGDDYVTFVWDFTTGQCNGDIAAICLTSNRGGHLGCRFDARDDYYSSNKFDMIPPYGGNFWNVGRNPAGTGFTAFMLWSFALNDSNHYLIVEDDGELVCRRGTTIKRFALPSSADFKINDGATRPTIQPTTETATAFAGEMIRSLNQDIAVARSISGTTMTVYKYDKTMLTPSGIEVPLTNISTSVRDFTGASGNVYGNALLWYYNDKFILIYGVVNNSASALNNKLRCYILNLDGSFVYHDTEFTSGVITTLFGTTVKNGVFTDTSVGVFGDLTVIDDELYLICGVDNNGYGLLHIDITTGEIESIPRYSMAENPRGRVFKSDDGFVTKPYYDVSYVGYISETTLNYKGAVMMPNFLSTINNMDVVLTKTADKTMKIVYTLTQASE